MDGRAKYSQEKRTELITELCDHIANGGTMREWCDDSMHPPRKTILEWVESDESFRNQYTRAYELQADYLAEELLAIADDQSGDWTFSKRAGGMVVDETAIARARLQVEARKWLMGKRKPKVYGDRLNVDQNGEVKVLVSYGTAPAPALTEGVIDADFVDQTSQNVQEGV